MEKKTAKKGKASTRKSRNGLHKSSKGRISLYLDKLVKAVAVYVCQLCDLTMTELVLDGIRERAIRAGVMNDNGEIVEKHKVAIEAIARILEEKEVGDGK